MILCYPFAQKTQNTACVRGRKMQRIAQLIFNEKLPLLIYVEVCESCTGVKTIGMKAFLQNGIKVHLTQINIVYRIIQSIDLIVNCRHFANQEIGSLFACCISNCRRYKYHLHAAFQNVEDRHFLEIFFQEVLLFCLQRF